MADADPSCAPEAEALATITDAPEKAPRRWLRPLLMFGVPLLIVADRRLFLADVGPVRVDRQRLCAAGQGRRCRPTSPAASSRSTCARTRSVKAGDLLFRDRSRPLSDRRRAGERRDRQRAGQRRDAARQLSAAPAPTSPPRATRSSSAQEDYAPPGGADEARLHDPRPARAVAARAAAGARTPRQRAGRRRPRRAPSSAPAPPCPAQNPADRRRAGRSAPRRARPVAAPRSARRSAAWSARPTGCRSAR